MDLFIVGEESLAASAVAMASIWEGTGRSQLRRFEAELLMPTNGGTWKSVSNRSRLLVGRPILAADGYQPACGTGGNA